MDQIRTAVQMLNATELQKHLETRLEIEHLAAVAGAASSAAVLLGLLLLTVANCGFKRRKPL